MLLDFNEWAKITHSYIPGEFYENSEKFMQAVCNNIWRVPGTMMSHAVTSVKWFMFQWNIISFGFATQLVFVTNASILHFNLELAVMAEKNFLW